MALSKKKLRPITVNDQGYRWQFFENSGWNDVTIQSSDGVGPKLVVQFPWEHEGTPHISLLPPVTPSIVRSLIEQACEMGWQPQGPGKVMNVRYSRGELVPLVSNKLDARG